MTHVLTLNAGSSSLKFGLFTHEHDPQPLITGLVERIGGAAAIKLKDAQGKTLSRHGLTQDEGGSHETALHAALSEIEARFPDASIEAVGHRVVHGGKSYSDPMDLTEEVLVELERMIPYAPLHQPHNLAGIRAALAAFPGAVQVACFDTAFHRNHPFVNDTYALPRGYYQRGIRRYGFHGLSYEYISDRLKQLSPTVHAGKVAVAHLGNGASMCAMIAGRSIATTMGFTALDGLPMGTRSGQLDPGIILYLMDQQGLSPAEISELLYTKSGLLGLSGVSSDMRTLLESDLPEAREAVDYFCVAIRSALGELAAHMEGLDGLVFTGGIGENSAAVRAQVCSRLRWLGIDMEKTANANGETIISSPYSRVHVMVIPTNEELVIARTAARHATANA